MMNDTAKRRRIKIGLLVSHLEDDFDDAVAEGAPNKILPLFLP